MTADGLQPPYFIRIIESDAVGFVGSVFFQQCAQAFYAFPCGVNIRKHKNDKILFAKTARLFFLGISLCLIDHIGVGAEHPRVGRDRLGCGHSDIRFVDSAGCPDAVFRIDTRACGVAHRIVRKCYLPMSDDTGIFIFLIFRIYDNGFLYIEMPVIGAGNHCRSVITGQFSDQNRCTCHTAFSPCSPQLFYTSCGVFETHPFHSFAFTQWNTAMLFTFETSADSYMEESRSLRLSTVSNGGVKNPFFT